VGETFVDESVRTREEIGISKVGFSGASGDRLVSGNSATLFFWELGDVLADLDIRNQVISGLFHLLAL